MLIIILPEQLTQAAEAAGNGMLLVALARLAVQAS
jgi:hypothetical protein